MQSSPIVQLSLPGTCRLSEAVDLLAHAGSEERGAIFTKREVVGFILDLVGYTSEKPLHTHRILEPSFGGGDFLLPIIDRLLTAYQREQRSNVVDDLASAIRGVELHHATFLETAGAVEKYLIGRGLSAADALALRCAWLSQGDFLLADIDAGFSHIVGNPPYIRQELIPEILIDEYRRRFTTVYDRADIYVPFIERSLSLLDPGAALGFICADRWMKNRYGGPLRRLISERYHLRAYVDMVDTPAFLSEVVAYPAIFVIGNERGTVTRIARRPQIDAQHLTQLAAEIGDDDVSASTVEEVGLVTSGSEPWIMEAADKLELVRRLEASFPPLEEAGCKVGIGVATGADKAFIGPLDELDVEDDRKLPLVMTRDINSGSIKWRGNGVVNPFADEGGLVNLDHYPRLQRYLEARKDEIAGRHVAQKAPANWYRTIDRITPSLVAKPKLLIPDIKGGAHIVYDEGRFYPHHNLYFITSDGWDLRALQTVLMSGIARLFISTYSTKMRGGYLRFQAQYLRRIRVPLWRDVPAKVRAELIEASESHDRRSCDEAIAHLYGLSAEDRVLIATVGESG